MCTVSVVSDKETVRLACNRDEQRSRPGALPPQVRRFGRHRAILPLDPTSGGTWIAVNDAGLAVTLLNVNQKPEEKEKLTPSRSRGAIIPSLLHCDDLDSALAEALALDPTHYATFRLLLAECAAWAEIHSDGRRIHVVMRGTFSQPFLLTSSGLGDHLVEGPRKALFAEFVDGCKDVIHQQDLFHRHRWNDRLHLSVCMSRADARTVSYTLVLLGPDRVTLSYHPDAPDQPADPVAESLDLLTGAES
jgi:hypothetical protein